MGWEWNVRRRSRIRRRGRGEDVIITTLKVPKAGGIPTTKASVLRWLKHEGDTVRPGDPMVELETEKVSYELESPTEGILLKIIAAENAQVPVGGALCQIGQADDLAAKKE